VLPPTTHRHESPLDDPATYETGRGAGKSPSTSPTPAATDDTARKLEPYLASIDNTLKGLGPCLAQINVLAPYLEQVARILERLERRERLELRQAPVVPPRPEPRAVPTPITTAKKRTLIRYLGRKDAHGTYREAGAQPTPQSTPLREALGSNGSDTPLSKVATPRGQSPEMVNEEGTSQSCPNDGGSVSEADEAPTRPTEGEQSSTYRKAGAQPTAPDQTSDGNDMPTCQREHAAMFD